MLGNFRFEESVKSGGRTTRSNAAFFDEPVRPSMITRLALNEEKRNHIQNILRSFEESLKKTGPKLELNSIALSSLKNLMQPYYFTMSNIAGGVHSCSQETLFHFLKKMKLNPKTSVLLECGSGAPLFGLAASIFTKVTICIDLPSVMKTIFWILSFMSQEDSLFARTIHYIPGFTLSNISLIKLADILEMRLQHFHHISSTMQEVTHVTAFIGLPDGP